MSMPSITDMLNEENKTSQDENLKLSFFKFYLKNTGYSNWDF